MTGRTEGQVAAPADVDDELGPCPVCGAEDWVWFDEDAANACFCGPCGTVINTLSDLFDGGGGSR